MVETDKSMEEVAAAGTLMHRPKRTKVIFRFRWGVPCGHHVSRGPHLLPICSLTRPARSHSTSAA